MRLVNRRGKVVSAAFTAGLILIASCSDNTPTTPGLGDVGISQTRNSGPTFSSTNLGALPGDNSSRANGVNDAGEVVGYSCCSVNSRAFIKIGSNLTALPGSSANALAISNGTTRYVVGWAGAPSLPVRWTITGGSASQPTYLALGTETWGSAIGVNDAGAAVGHVGNEAAMWDTDGNLTLIAAPSGFVRGEGRGIDNSGHAVFEFFRPDPAWPDGITVGYLRLVTGEMIQLGPVGSDGISYVNNLSQVSGTTVKIAGSTYSGPSASRGVRWTVDVVQQQITGTEVRSEASHAVGISSNGIVAGFLDGAPSSLRSTAFRWDASQLLSLTPPKGGKEGKAWGISPNGVFVAGEAMIQPSRTAVLWRITSP